MLINLSNHPSATWSEQQKQVAVEQFGEVVDMLFPAIDPAIDEKVIEILAKDFLEKIKQVADDNHAMPVVHLMGEYTFCFALINKLKDEGIEAVVSTSHRDTQINDDGSKTIRFNFVRFRKYL